MGGGDLNSKKSWHPNTIKNQERVWKAEKAAAVEKQRIAELQREHAEERDRSELNELVRQKVGASGDNRLSWMYNKPDKKGHQEDYLLGKTIDSNFDDTKEQDAIPAVSRRVVGSSMMSGAGDTQVDLARKMREDPLLLVKERERAARAALLNNPLQRKKLTELLRREQEQRKEKKAPKKKHKDLDDKLAAKLNALGDNGLNLAALLASGDSSSESSSSDAKSKKKKHKKEKKSKKKKKEKKSKKKNTEQESSDEDDHYHRDKGQREQQSKNQISNHRKYDKGSDSHIDERRAESKTSKRRSRSADNDRNYSHRNIGNNEREYRKPSQSSYRRRSPSNEKRTEGLRKRHSPSEDKRDFKKAKGLNAAEREARLAEMARAGVEHERERGARVAHQRAAGAAEEAASRRPRVAPDARALPPSLESRIHSNRHNIQRNERHMNEHFARR